MELRPVRDDELEAFGRLNYLAFHEQPGADEVDRWRRLIEL